MVPGREKGLTLGAQSICAVLSGLAVPFARLASVSRRRRVASPTALPLTLAAAYGPLAPLVPASVNCIMGTCGQRDYRVHGLSWHSPQEEGVKSSTFHAEG